MEQETLTPQDLQAFRGIPNILKEMKVEFHELRHELKEEVAGVKDAGRVANGRSPAKKFDVAEFDLYLATAQIVGAYWATPELRKGLGPLLLAGPTVVGAVADARKREFDLTSRRFLIPALAAAAAWFTMRPKA